MPRATRLVSLVLLLASIIAPALSAHAEPAIWVVKGPHATVYLFGTVHALQKGQSWHSAKIDAAIKESGTLYLEIPNVDDAAAMQPLIMQLGLDQAHPLSTKLTPDQLAKLTKVAASAGLPGGESMLEPFKPWLAALTLSLMPLMKAGYDPSSGVELELKPQFVSANKPVKGFETAEQQLHYFDDMSDKAQVDYLVSELDDFDTGVEKFNKLIAAWYAGDVDALDQFNNAEFRDKHPDLFQTLVVKRNEAFTTQIETLLKGDGITFVAIGAGHLVGKEGVPAMLEKQGFKVTRE
ncbi:TraB/GumN family protein [Telmatobacter sp. DSM 110680]|uniref:TraB/GumN family protein n=1 Tax=Telmatobacter sp. DSM 110680 TaxID=3036704 RepID=A0AAU7DHM9_9BACT